LLEAKLHTNDRLLIDSSDKEDNQFSAFVLMNTFRNNSNPSSNEINLVNTPPGLKTNPYFFRYVTRTKCQIPIEEAKHLVENIIFYESQKANYFNEDYYNKKL